MINTPDELLDAFYKQRDIYTAIAPIQSISWEIGGNSYHKVRAMFSANGQAMCNKAYYIKNGKQFIQDTLLGYPVVFVHEDCIAVVFELRNIEHTIKRIVL